jgi:hypothetical protein
LFHNRLKSVTFSANHTAFLLPGNNFTGRDPVYFLPSQALTCRNKRGFPQIGRQWACPSYPWRKLIGRGRTRGIRILASSDSFGKKWQKYEVRSVVWAKWQPISIPESIIATVLGSGYWWIVLWTWHNLRNPTSKLTITQIVPTGENHSSNVFELLVRR